MSAVQVYASFEPKAQPNKRATRSDMLQALDDQKDGTDLVILDARGHGQYTGQVSATCDVANTRQCSMIIHQSSRSFAEVMLCSLYGPHLHALQSAYEYRLTTM